MLRSARQTLFPCSEVLPELATGRRVQDEGNDRPQTYQGLGGAPLRQSLRRSGTSQTALRTSLNDLTTSLDIRHDLPVYFHIGAVELPWSSST